MRTGLTVNGRLVQWSVVVIAACVAMGFWVVRSPQLALATVVAGAGFVMLMMILGTPRRIFLFAVFCLPFTQAPTLRLLFRWRAAELVAWLLVPLVLGMLPGVWKALPGPARWYLLAMLGYFVYSGGIGLASAPFVELVGDPRVLEVLYHPLLRTFLETARGMAALSLVAFGLVSLRGRADAVAAVTALCLGGALTGIYALYQTVDLRLGGVLPLLPGTLAHDYLRPFSTFYEPTGLGSYTAAAALLALGLMGPGTRRGLWLVALAANLLGLVLSLSRAGVAGFAVGGGVFMILVLLQRQLRAVVYMPLMGAVVWGAWTMTEVLVGQLREHLFSESWVTYSMELRLEVYSRLWSLLRDNPAGVGQGLWLFREGGVPGVVRLVVEGGVVGLLCLLGLHCASVIALKRLLRADEQNTRRLAACVAGAYVATSVVAFNYIHTTDAWIWFVWALPVLILSAVHPAERPPAHGETVRSLEHAVTSAPRLRLDVESRVAR